MILNIISTMMLTLGIYSAWRARPATGRSEVVAPFGEYLGGLLIVSGLVLLGWQPGHAVDFANIARS